MQKSKKYQELTNKKAIWFSNPNDVSYLTNFNSSFMEVFLIDGEWFVLTDNRYLTAAKEQIKDFKVMLFDEAFKSIILPKIVEAGGNLVVDSSYLTVERYTNLKDVLEKSKITLEPISFTGFREIKTEDELNKIRKAVSITDDLFLEILDFIKEGMTEIEVTKFIKSKIINMNLEPSFEPIVAAGANGSKPHHRGSDHKIAIGEMITIDFGLFYEGYASDMTRTVVLGELPSEEQQKIHNIILNSMETAIEAIKPGVEAKKIDSIARKYIEDAGYGKYFTHGTGHGVGLEVHEEPRVNQSSKTILEEGMVITVEPGIYIEGKCGVRIEQDIIVTKTDHEQLNKSDKKLKVI